MWEYHASRWVTTYITKEGERTMPKTLTDKRTRALVRACQAAGLGVVPPTAHKQDKREKNSSAETKDAGLSSCCSSRFSDRGEK